MKALSLKQPWAELVMQGKKKIEIRKWNTRFRGDFLIHASKSPDMDSMRSFGFSEDSLPVGKILGKVKLVDVISYKDDFDFEKDINLHLATPEWGKFGFVLENVERFEKPIDALGKLGFWESDLVKN
ncbi:MAG: ASCH domain-containing protein [archaeon]